MPWGRRSGHPGPSAALAIIDQEETGKALLFTMIGFALVPEGNPRSHRDGQPRASTNALRYEQESIGPPMRD